ncbi:MAG: hypothetical protein ACE5J3_08670 [Methanosarcinales archaeon]
MKYPELSEIEIKTLNVLNGSLSVNVLAKRVGVTKGYLSRIVSYLEKKRFVECRRYGITKLVSVADSLHASSFKALLSEKSYIPFHTLLRDSGLRILAILADLNTIPSSLKNLEDETGVSKPTLLRKLKKFREYGILQNYKISIDLNRMREFLRYYLEYWAVSLVKDFSSCGTLIFRRGFEFIFASPNEVPSKKIKLTGLSKISQEIPLLLTENYYFYSNKNRMLSNEEIIIHTILANPYSRRNTTYALLYAIKLGLNEEKLLFYADKYSLKEYAIDFINILNNKSGESKIYLPSPDYLKKKALEYNLKWKA